MERFLKRKLPLTDDNDENLDRGTSRRDGTAPNANHFTHLSSRVSRQEVNFDELPYDPADRRRISDYIGAVAKKNDDSSDFFDMVSLLLTVAGASCKRKDMIRESQHESEKSHRQWTA